MALRVGFAGTPVFAVPALEAIVAAGHSVPLVLTRPDKSKGRGLKLAESPVKSAARSLGLPIVQPVTLRDAAAVERLRLVPLDVLVVAAYGLILPPDVLAWPGHGCLNIHASMLPRWRGAAPIERAIEAGDRSTGVCIMQMDAGLDTGPVVLAREVPIDPRETAGSLRDKLAREGARAITEVLAALDGEGSVHAAAQSGIGVSYARKLSAEEARIDWRESASAIDRRVRAFDPEPGAYTFARGERVRIRSAYPIECAPGTPGSVVAVSSQGIDVACGEGALRIVDVQPAGGRAMHARAFLAGHSLAAGDRLGDVA